VTGRTCRGDALARAAGSYAWVAPELRGGTGLEEALGMLRRSISLASVVALFIVDAGCAERLHTPAGRVLVGAAILSYGIAANVHNPELEWTTTDGSAADDDDDNDDIDPGPRPVPPHEAASEADRRVEQRAPFALAAAYGALARVDLAPCAGQGLTTGYGRVVLAFTSDGAPAGVRVDLPSGSSLQAGACVEQAFRAVRVSAFDGAPVNVRRAFFVKDASTSATGPEHSL
jgi:hypothetical protein